MRDEDFEPTDEVDEEPDEELLLDEDELDEDDLVVEVDLDDDTDVIVDDLEEDLAVAPTVRTATGEAEEEEDLDDEDVVLDLEDEEDTTDIEDPLDVLLRERIESDLKEEEYDEDDEEEEDRSEGGSRIPSKRPGEFVCRSCFLVKAPSQLADTKLGLCRDCV